jgi:cold-inducible RNA-binding protein
VPVRLFVGNLPYAASETDLRAHFAAVGTPTHVALPVDRETGRPRGFAFVEFGDRTQAEEAIRRFDGQPFLGRNLVVNEARAREDRGPAPRPGPGMGMGPRPLPGAGGPPPAPGEGAPRSRERNFGPPAPPKGKRTAAARRSKQERGPKGPIPLRTTGRVFNVDNVEDEEEVAAESTDFEDFATSRPEDDAASESDSEPDSESESEE